MELLLAHLTGDFLIQNDWMAQNKKSSNLACTVHVASYMLPFLFLGLAWWQLLAIAGQHWIQDRTSFVKWYMEFMGSSDFAKPPLAPWSIFVVDMTFHLLFIGVVVSVGGVW